ncbi:MAG: hypothetical protein ABI333_06190 [bacterium]
MSRSVPLLLLLAGVFLSVGSAKRSARAPESRVLKRAKDPQLRHPALQVVNRSPEVLRLALRGPVKRLVIAPPHENARTLIAAGVYKLELRLGGKVVRRERVLLRKGHRYLLEIAP